MSLKAFDPHRPTFTCKLEADFVPRIDPEADQWFQEGLRLTSHLLWRDERDYTKAAQLWQQAADRKHWKAILNLASAYANGEGVEKNTEQAVQILEMAMNLGIPSAFDLMGNFHANGTGVKSDSSRAYALWELAADMGSANAQAYLGAKLAGTYDDPKGGFWGNRKVALSMLACAYAQDNGKAAYEYGTILANSPPELNEHGNAALQILHDGVKFGSEDCAAYLFSSFDRGNEMVLRNKDRARAERYLMLSDALRHDPDLRLPNLDKVLPLPPAQLPQWDGKKQSLIDAAKAVAPRAPIPPPPSFPASTRTGRAHVPEGWVLPDLPPPGMQPQPETTSAPATGYWIARLLRPRTERHRAWDAEQVPLRYETRESFDKTRPGLVDDDGRIYFHYVGLPIRAPEPTAPLEDVRVARGIARAIDAPLRVVECRGDFECPRTGIWSARVDVDHPSAIVFNQWSRQSYVDQDQRFPDPARQHLAIDSKDVTWRWWASANDVVGPGLTRIHLEDDARATSRGLEDVHP